MNNLTIQEEALAKEIGIQLRKSLEDTFVGTKVHQGSSREICNFVENFLRSNQIQLVPVVYINGPKVDISFIGDT